MANGGMGDSWRSKTESQAVPMNREPRRNDLAGSDELSPSEQDACLPDSILLWVERARDGERHAFERLIRAFEGEIFRMAYYRLHSRMDAEDVTQEVFLKAFRKLAQLREPERFRTWLFRMAVNQTQDFLRKRRFLRFLGFSSEPPSGEALLEHPDHRPNGMAELLRKEFWEHFKRLLAALSKWEREVFLLRYLDHLPIKDIATVVNKSESAVKTHLYRALSKVRNDPTFLSLCKGVQYD